MNQQDIIKLSQIYNTLLLIETKGESTLTMSDCLRALEEVINSIKQSQQLLNIEQEE